ncbi:hypothetical protein EOL96_01755 [Candidatus Saccharibacteria bacterium]|nr:hypothetical protein [Candidatus Saccharibacteria bacterium]
MSEKCGNCFNEALRESRRRQHRVEDEEKCIEEIERKLADLKGFGRHIMGRARLREQLRHQQILLELDSQYRPLGITADDIDNCDGPFERTRPCRTIDASGETVVDEDYEWHDALCGAGASSFVNEHPLQWGVATETKRPRRRPGKLHLDK